PPAVNVLRKNEQIARCKANLAKIGFALHSYRDQHKGAFPSIKDEKEPFKVAGLFAPVLLEGGMLPSDARFLKCPGDQSSPPPSSLPLGQLHNLPAEEFERVAANLAGSYAYSLGYRDADGGYQGLRADPNLPQHLVPILADLPPRDPRQGNSP